MGDEVNRLRYSHMSEAELGEVFLDIIEDSAVLRQALTRAQELDLPNWRIVSGALIIRFGIILRGAFWPSHPAAD